MSRIHVSPAQTPWPPEWTWTLRRWWWWWWAAPPADHTPSSWILITKLEVSDMSSVACNIQSLTQPHVLAGPGHVVVEGEVVLETSLDPLAGAAPLLLTLEIEEKHYWQDQVSLTFLWRYLGMIRRNHSTSRSTLGNANCLDKKFIFTSISIISGTLEVSIFLPWALTFRWMHT